MQRPEGRPRLLLITRNLPPLVGGMERMMFELASGIDNYAELTVIGPRGCSYFLPPTIHVHECPQGLASFLLQSAWQALQILRKQQFDLVIGGSGITAPLLRLLTRWYKSRCAIYLHGLDLVVNHPIYQAVFVPCTRAIDGVAVNSRNTRRLAEESGIPANRLTIIHPGVNLPAPIGQQERAALRQRHGITYTRYIVFVGRMTRRKGLSGFLRHAMPRILESEPSLGLIIVGEDPRDSLNRMGEQAAIVEEIARSGLAGNVRFLGKLEDRELEVCFAEASAQVFPLVEVAGDVEGFGMVALEAAACGTPTVAFNLGGVADAISGDSGHLIPPADYPGFAAAVIRVLRENLPTDSQCRAHAATLTWDVYNAGMQKLIMGLVSAAPVESGDAR